MMAVKGCMKIELFKEGRKHNKGLNLHRPNIEKLNLSLKKQEDLPPAAACERAILGKDPQGDTGRQQIWRNDF